MRSGRAAGLGGCFLDVKHQGGLMRLDKTTSYAVLTLGVLFTTPLFAQAPRRAALSVHLQCAGGDCPLLHGFPQTAGMRSGFVRL
jgi:hypothetical protein